MPVAQTFVLVALCIKAACGAKVADTRVGSSRIERCWEISGMHARRRWRLWEKNGSPSLARKDTTWSSGTQSALAELSVTFEAGNLGWTRPVEGRSSNSG